MSTPLPTHDPRHATPDQPHHHESCIPKQHQHQQWLPLTLFSHATPGLHAPPSNTTSHYPLHTFSSPTAPPAPPSPISPHATSHDPPHPHLNLTSTSAAQTSLGPSISTHHPAAPSSLSATSSTAYTVLSVVASQHQNGTPRHRVCNSACVTRGYGVANGNSRTRSVLMSLIMDYGALIGLRNVPCFVA